MIFRAWDEPHGFTDIDLGITAADTAGEDMAIPVWQDGDVWRWALTRPEPILGPDGTPSEWIDEEVDGGTAETEAEAEAAGEAAMESYLRGLIRNRR